MYATDAFASLNDYYVGQALLESSIDLLGVLTERYRTFKRSYMRWSVAHGSETEIVTEVCCFIFFVLAQI